MTDEELFKLFLLMRKPIPWDPAPVWAKMTREQVAKFNEVQLQFNAKLAELEMEKIQELGKIAGIGIR